MIKVTTTTFINAYASQNDVRVWWPTLLWEVIFYDMLYFIQCYQYYKVGCATDIYKRMKTYATHNPYVKLIGVKDGDMKEEREYHQLYENFPHWGEWAKIPPKLVAYIAEDFTPLKIDYKPLSPKEAQEVCAEKTRSRSSKKSKEK